MLHINKTKSFFYTSAPNLLRRCITNSKPLEGQTASSVTEAQEHEEQIAEQPSTKLPPRLPLAKNFFVGLVDKELLGFPEVIDRESMARLKNEIMPFNNFFNEDFFESHRANASTNTLPTDLADNLKNLGLYGINLSDKFDGKGWGYSESFIASEPESQATDVSLSLLGHRCVIDILQEFGSHEQKQRFLTKLGNGSMVASEAIYELDRSDEDYFNTKGHEEVETNTWILNGTKSFVIAPPKSSEATQLFVVIAQTQKENIQTEFCRSTTLFLIDSTMPGVKLGERHQTLGCRATTMQTVFFENVRVPDSYVLGHAHEGNLIAEKLLQINRLRSSIINLGLAKNIYNILSKHGREKNICGVQLKELESTQSCLASSYLSVYGMESMIYLTAGILDEFNKPDIVLESAICRYHSLKELFNLCNQTLDIMGTNSLISGESSEIYFRNAAQLYTLGDSIDNLGIYIALSGLQHAGITMGDAVRKQRNPLYYPAHIFSKFMEMSTIENPRTKMNLRENVHPSLEPSALMIEHSVARLQMCVDLLFSRYGNTIVERHNDARRLADMVASIYAMFSSVSRASRSYCIGLQYSDHELLAATSICCNGRDKVKTLAQEILHGHYVNNDNNFRRLSRQIFKSKGYFATHPLTYNF